MLSGFHIFLKKKPTSIFTLKARNIQRETERQRETETEKETERRRDILKSGEIGEIGEIIEKRKEKREERKEKRAGTLCQLPFVLTL